ATCRRSCIAPSMAIRCVTSFSGLMKPDVLRKASGGDDVENQCGKCVRIEGRSTASFRKSPWRLEQLTYAGGVKRTGKIIPLAELAVQSTQLAQWADRLRPLGAHVYPQVLRPPHDGTDDPQALAALAHR